MPRVFKMYSLVNFDLRVHSCNHHHSQDNGHSHQPECFLLLFCDSFLLPLTASQPQATMPASYYHKLVCILEFHVHRILPHMLFHVAPIAWRNYIELHLCCCIIYQ